tara:strand:- start:799 stop:1116 length:318 start_codon:yes stop_codon:yes gene_type:complete
MRRFVVAAVLPLPFTCSAVPMATLTALVLVAITGAVIIIAACVLATTSIHIHICEWLTLRVVLSGVHSRSPASAPAHAAAIITAVGVGIDAAIAHAAEDVVDAER